MTNVYLSPEDRAARLRNRLMRFIEYNCNLYIQHRTRADYREAIRRLQLAAKLASSVDQAEREGRLQLSVDDRATVGLVHRHLRAMIPENVVDFTILSGHAATAHA